MRKLWGGQFAGIDCRGTSKGSTPLLSILASKTPGSFQDHSRPMAFGRKRTWRRSARSSSQMASAARLPSNWPPMPWTWFSMASAAARLPADRRISRGLGNLAAQSLLLPLGDPLGFLLTGAGGRGDGPLGLLELGTDAIGLLLELFGQARFDDLPFANEGVDLLLHIFSGLGSLLGRGEQASDRADGASEGEAS